MVTILMMSAKMVTLGLLKIKLIWNNGYDVIIFVYGAINNILSCDSNDILYGIIWPKFGNSSISMREVIITSILSVFDQKNHYFFFFLGGRGWWSWFKFNNLGLVRGTNLKLYSSVEKRLKLKFKMFWGLIPTFVEATWEKQIGQTFLPAPPYPE